MKTSRRGKKGDPRWIPNEHRKITVRLGEETYLDLAAALGEVSIQEFWERAVKKIIDSKEKGT